MGYLGGHDRPGRRMANAKRLVDVLPPEFMNGQYEDSPAMPLAFMDVIAVHRSSELAWPGSHRNVNSWYVLLNGKAVGWNENPTRGWSFPVINYQEAQQEPTTDPLSLRFRSALHRSFHLVLVKYGFSFVVSSDLMISFDYRHPSGISVVLTPVDDDLEYAVLKADGARAFGKQDYSEDEWAWVESSPDDVERMARDLFILITTRPEKMYFPKNAQGAGD